MSPRQFWVSLILSLILLAAIIRLIQKHRLEIAYCWFWLALGIAGPLVVLNYKALLWFTKLIGAVTPTTTLFLFSILLLFAMNLQFSMIISKQRGQIKRLAQDIAIRTAEARRE